MEKVSFRFLAELQAMLVLTASDASVYAILARGAALKRFNLKLIEFSKRQFSVDELRFAGSSLRCFKAAMQALSSALLFTAALAV